MINKLPFAMSQRFVVGLSEAVFLPRTEASGYMINVRTAPRLTLAITYENVALNVTVLNPFNITHLVFLVVPMFSDINASILVAVEHNVVEFDPKRSLNLVLDGLQSGRVRCV